MNERIKELAKQADPQFTGECNDDMGHALIGTEAIEKFAELIVQECADLFEVEYGQSKVSGNEIAEVVKKHFGVHE